MQTQMNQTVQALRSEVEAVTTLQLALNRIALSVDDNSLSVWDGPRPEDVDDLAADDGSFSREAVLEVRQRAGEALARRYTEVERVIIGRAALEALARSALHTGTSGVVTQDGQPTAQVLSALARSGAINLDAAQAAVAEVREALEARAAAKPVKVKARKPAAKAKAPAKKPAARKPARKAVKASSRKPGKAVKAKAPAKKKKPAAKARR